MARYRIGNDMTILWTVNDRDGKALPLQDKEVHLYYTCERGRFEADFEIQKTNTVVWNFYGGLQKTLGTYSLTLEILHPDSKSSIKKDVCSAFCLVGKDCEADAKETTVNGEITVYQEVITTNLDIARIQPIIPQVVRDENGIGYWYVDGVNTGDRSTGESAYEYAKKKGYEGTEEEFAGLQAGISTLILDYENYKEQSAEGFASLGRQINELGRNMVSVSDIDSALSTESENPVQNKVVTEELNKKVEGYYAVLASVDLTGKYVNTVPLGIAITDGLEIYLHYHEWYGLKKFVLNKANDFYHEEWNETDDFLLQAKYEDGVLTLDEPNNGAVDLFELVEVIDSKAIDDSLIPDTISRTADVEDAMGDIEESVEELREETTALWENLDHGVFPNLVAGDLAGRGESVPAEFGFRASGGKSIKDGRAYIKSIKGNSVVWNQMLLDSTNIVTSSGTKALNEGTRIVAGHKYLLFADFGGGTDYAGVNLFARVNGESKSIFGLGNNERKTYKFVTAEIGGISNGTGAAVEGNVWQYFYFVGTTESITNTRLTDLTQTFGAGNEPTTIEDFNTRVATLGVDMNAYNEGEVIHCNTESIKSVGDNAWDEQWGEGRLNTNTGQPNYGNNGIFSKNYIRVLPNETYYCGYNAAPIFAMFYDAEYNLILQVSGSNHFINIRNRQFTTPANAVYMRFYVTEVTTYNNDILISLYHSGWKAEKDDQYQPYWEDTLSLPIINKYFPDGMKKVVTAHDEIRFNKATQKWEKVVRIGEVDMGDCAWGYKPEDHVFTTYTIMDLMAHPVDVNERNKGLMCAKYAPSIGLVADKSWLRIPNSVAIKDTAYTDAESFKAAMAGVTLYFELAEPIVTELDAEDQNFRDYYNVADFGTEMSQSSVPSAPFSADIIYQFNAVDMIREHELEITELQKVIATMQAQLASLTNS